MQNAEQPWQTNERPTPKMPADDQLPFQVSSSLVYLVIFVVVGFLGAIGVIAWAISQKSGESNPFVIVAVVIALVCAAVVLTPNKKKDKNQG